MTETDAVIYRYFKVMQDIVHTYGVSDKDAIRMLTELMPLYGSMLTALARIET
jgi:hypothetical protein